MNYLVLVNKNNKFEDNNLDLVDCKDIMDRPIKVERTTYNAYLKLKEFLETKNIFIEIDSSYRSLEEQQKILDDTIKESGLEHASKYVAPVGYSEHHTGLAIDLALIVNGKKISDDGTNDMFSYDDIFKEIHKYLKDFGFILRYPEGKEDITGYGYEPWHIRYVGEAAKDIYNAGLTLEEYLGPFNVEEIVSSDTKRRLKRNSKFAITFSSIFLILSFILFLGIALTPSEPNSFDDLGKIFAVYFFIAIVIVNIPLLIASITTMCNVDDVSKYKKCIRRSIISIVMYTILILVFIILDVLSIFSDYSTGEVYVIGKLIAVLVMFSLFILPTLLNVIELYKVKENSTIKELLKKNKNIQLLITIVIVVGVVSICKALIINKNKIIITEDNLYSYSEFTEILRDRGFIDNIPSGQKVLAGARIIHADDSKSKYGYEFSNGSYTDYYNLSVDTDRKFPFFEYEGYTSLIAKSNLTADYYYIGPEDWYITWNIYYVNGEVYAAINEESKYDSSWSDSISNTKYGVVVAESKKITIYNANKNYLVKGGCIVDVSRGMQQMPLPETSDIYSMDCMKIRVVDRVDAETLDAIAKELSPQYWKKHNN